MFNQGCVAGAQGQLTQERMRTQTLRSRLTHMENQYHATLDRISETALIPAHRAFHEDQDGPVTMSCLPFGGGGGRPKQLPTAASPQARAAAPSPSLPAAGDSAGGAEEHAEVAGGADVAVTGAAAEHQSEMPVLPLSTAISVG